MYYEDDPRLCMALGNGLHYFPDNRVWHVHGVIGVGGSAITYDVSQPDRPSRHYALKEYCPFSLAPFVIRNSDQLCVEEDFVEAWNNGRVDFLKDDEIQTRLPHSNEEGGQYFIYGIESFIANNTAYIVLDSIAGKPLTLKDTMATQKTATRREQKNAMKMLLSYLCDTCRGLEKLHKNGILHLDISDTNIMVSSGGAQITDFGSAFLMEKSEDSYMLPTDRVAKHQFTYTPGFSPIELFSAVDDSESLSICEATDTYSVCAVLYKYLYGSTYNPATDTIGEHTEKNTIKNAVFTPAFPCFDKLPGTETRMLIDLLKKGLGGVNGRYTAAELKEELEDILKTLKSNTYTWITGIAIGVCALSLVALLGSWLSVPTPKVIPNVDAFYSQNDTIELTLDIENATGAPITASCLNEITTSGFTANSIKFEPLAGTDPNIQSYKIYFQNIISEVDGEKSIELRSIYKNMLPGSPFGKWNKSVSVDFYYGPNIRCSISEPSVTKVNSGVGHNVDYTLTFDSPVDFEISIDTVGLHGFETEKTTSTSLGNNQVRLTFENVSGDVGDDKYFILYEKTAYADETHYLRQTKSPTFSIVEEEVTNAQIHVVYSVLQKDVRDGGFVILSPSVMNAPSYQNHTTPADVTLDGFDAEIKVSGEDIVLYNLQIPEDSDELCVSVKAGTIVSENGSQNEEIRKVINSAETTDTSIPTLNMALLSDNRQQSIEEGSTVIYKLFVADNDNVSFSAVDLFRYIKLVGFKGEVAYKKADRACYICVSNIRPDDSGEVPHIVIKEGIAIDDTGNKSHQIGSPAFKFK